MGRRAHSPASKHKICARSTRSLKCITRSDSFTRKLIMYLKKLSKKQKTVHDSKSRWNHPEVFLDVGELHSVCDPLCGAGSWQRARCQPPGWPAPAGMLWRSTSAGAEGRTLLAKCDIAGPQGASLAAPVKWTLLLSVSCVQPACTVHPCTVHTRLQQLAQTHQRIRVGSSCATKESSIWHGSSATRCREWSQQKAFKSPQQQQPQIPQLSRFLARRLMQIVELKPVLLRFRPALVSGTLCWREECRELTACRHDLELQTTIHRILLHDPDLQHMDLAVGRLFLRACSCHVGPHFVEQHSQTLSSCFSTWQLAPSGAACREDAAHLRLQRLGVFSSLRTSAIPTLRLALVAATSGSRASGFLCSHTRLLHRLGAGNRLAGC